MGSRCTWGISEMEAIDKALEESSVPEGDAVGNPGAAEQMSFLAEEEMAWMQRL